MIAKMEPATIYDDGEGLCRYAIHETATYYVKAWSAREAEEKFLENLLAGGPIEDVTVLKRSIFPEEENIK